MHDWRAGTSGVDWVLLWCSLMSFCCTLHPSHFATLHRTSVTCHSGHLLDTPQIPVPIIGLSANLKRGETVQYFCLFVIIHLFHNILVSLSSSSAAAAAASASPPSSTIIIIINIIITINIIIIIIIIYFGIHFYYTPVWKTGRIMPWQCPSVRLSVRPSVRPSAFSGLFFNMLWDINLKLGIYIQ